MLSCFETISSSIARRNRDGIGSKSMDIVLALRVDHRDTTYRSVTCNEYDVDRSRVPPDPKGVHFVIAQEVQDSIEASGGIDNRRRHAACREMQCKSQLSATRRDENATHRLRRWGCGGARRRGSDILRPWKVSPRFSVIARSQCCDDRGVHEVVELAEPDGSLRASRFELMRCRECDHRALKCAFTRVEHSAGGGWVREHCATHSGTGCLGDDRGCAAV
jgi:hypothetical protein